MKVAVSLPDDVFAAGEAMARKLKTSRSSLYARAIAEFAARHDSDGLTERMNAALATGAMDDTPFAKAAARRAFAQTEW
jgi:predicted transcriptional regulator